ncbi:hypothetical protein BOTBODRAFT_27626 [Botryobasidium botryosum FD-172 SS1]|uniref:Uncharacterized protein n=1 Tax=Botryobasidium botryosum (strain FD-172 SS1) TaxID=930990 RepID=A0A067MX64_BOTB1|nr:hypothetical protein BOTBODRAFT_27626 [Botryobasidium botryosum FD-172 SS1]
MDDDRVIFGSGPGKESFSIPLPSDPYLDYQPHFAFSLPIQILLTGIVLTLVSVLFIHLLFTAKYHWSLAKLNYCLQLAGSVCLLISLGATLTVIMNTTHATSRQWPYMLTYIAVSIPPSNWTDAQKASWYVMESTTSGLAHITHIQFLTLLYPSALEARLIFFLLGPLAIASSGMVFTSMNEVQQVRDLGDAIRNVCNSTLSLLFTAALLIWGVLVKRKQAWRTDGGTAVFGAGALTLAVMSTIVNFILIPEDGLIWLPSMLWAVVLWQNFLGWWWWVGSGMGIDDIEDMLLKEQKRKEARVRRQRRKSNRHNQAHGSGAGSGGGQDGDGDGGNGSASGSRITRWSDSIAARKFSRRRRNTGRHEDEGGIELDALNHPRPASNFGDQQLHRDGHQHQHQDVPRPPPTTITTFTNTSNESSALAFARTVPVLSSLVAWWSQLRQDHLHATKAQALEQVELRRQGGAGGGWGLGDFGVRNRDEVERRIREFDDELRRGRLIDNADGGREGDRDRDRDKHEDEDGIQEEWIEEEVGEGVPGPSRPRRTHFAAPDHEYEHEREHEHEYRRQPVAGPSRHRDALDNPASFGASSHYRADSADGAADAGVGVLGRGARGGENPFNHPPIVPEEAGWSLWWWGPLRRWRLQDRTAY